MNSEEQSKPGIGLSFTRRMPLSWQHCAAATVSRGEEPEGIRNKRLLQLLLFYDEYHQERRDDEGEHKSDLERVEAKLEAIIQLLGFLVGQRASGAGERLVCVAAHHLEWVEQKSSAPTTGDRLWILLEIDPRLPQSLKMAAGVVQLTPVDADWVRVRVKLDPQGERVQEALEKLIFRMHRREIARMRSDN